MKSRLHGLENFLVGDPLLVVHLASVLSHGVSTNGPKRTLPALTPTHGANNGL